MKDVPHHMMKFLKKMSKEPEKKEESDKEEEDVLFQKGLSREKSSDQKRKQKKLTQKKERTAHIPSDLTPEERNRKMKKRIPMRRERSMKKICIKSVPS